MARNKQNTADASEVRVRQMRESTGMNRKEFCEYFEIPYRTVSDWEGGLRHAPEYVLRLLEYYIRVQGPGRTEGAEADTSCAGSNRDWDKENTVSMAAETSTIYVAGNDDHTKEELEMYETDGENVSSYFREEAPAYKAKRQGEYTLEDYYALPDDVRAELIDGVIFIMEAPTSPHQILTIEICHQLRNYIDSEGGNCIVLAAPVDVQLDCDDKTMVEPDVLVLCDRDKMTRKNIQGAPDLVMEVLSPSTKKKDMFLKLNKYQNAGVKEYWIIDPDQKRVIVYDFAHDDYPALYSFDDSVPVGLYDGRCCIDFKKIYEYMSFLY